MGVTLEMKQRAAVVTNYPLTSAHARPCTALQLPGRQEAALNSHSIIN